MTMQDATLDQLKEELQNVNNWLTWSYNLRSKQGGWILWNGDEEEENERYRNKIIAEINKR